VVIVTIGEKILMELDKQGKQQKELAEYIGIKPASISDWNKSKDVKFQNVVKASEFLNLSLNYLAYGTENEQLSRLEKELLKTFSQLSINNKKMALGLMRSIYETQTEIESRAKIKYHSIKHSLYKVSAGIGYDLDDDSWETIKVIDTPESRKADFAVTVDGDSMLPKYKDGDIVLVRVQQDIDIGQVGIFIKEGKGYLKEKGKDRLISLNPDYPDILPSEYDEIKCCGLVIGKAYQDDNI